MARIAGVDLPDRKRADIALTYLFGIGRNKALTICGKAGIDGSKKMKDLSEDEVSRIRRVITDEVRVEGDLRRDVAMDIKRMVEIGCYRGLRHRRNLPVRGQRTHTNARTRKGPKRTVMAKPKAPTK